MFNYFPGNYTWSSAFVQGLMAGGQLGEIHRWLATLTNAEPDLDAWTEHGAGMAQQQEQLAAIDVKKTFWEDLKSDLEVVAQEWTLLPEKQAATALTGVITVA